MEFHCGPEFGDGTPTGYAMGLPIGEKVLRARETGVAAVTLARGYDPAIVSEAPWLLLGAKSLSYAMNMASQRWALRSGAHDVLWVSADGYALEAPTSTLVWLDGTALCTVPVEPTGILAGTTARWLLDQASSLGWTTTERMIAASDLVKTDGAWFTSSVRGVAAIRELDGLAMPYSPDITDRIRDLLGYA